MSGHDIDAVIQGGTHDLLPGGPVHQVGETPIEPGEAFSYRVLTVNGPVADDLSIPVTVEFQLPKRFRGRRVDATLVPHDRSQGGTTALLKGLGLGPLGG